MSTSVILLIPTDPEFVPAALSQEQAMTLLQSLLPDPASVVTARVTEYVEFVAQGENFERIVCPFCPTELVIQWWHEVMNKAYERRFTDLSVNTPCCHAETSLNDLQYEWPAGFARFVLELYEPFVRDPDSVYGTLELSAETLEKLKEVLGCPLRVIRAHY